MDLVRAMTVAAILGAALLGGCGVAPTCDLIGFQPQARVVFPAEIALPYRADVTTGPGRFEVAREVDAQGNELPGLTLVPMDGGVHTYRIECGEDPAAACSPRDVSLPDLPERVSIVVTSGVEVAIDAADVDVEYVIDRGDGAEGCPANRVRGQARVGAP